MSRGSRREVAMTKSSSKLLFLVILPALSLGLTERAAFAQGGPPMLTDDPGTPGNRHWEINTAALIRKWFAKRPRFHLHFTPTYGSWINLVERWFAELTNKRIRRGVFRSVKELEAAIREYIEVHNENPKPFVWTKTAD